MKKKRARDIDDLLRLLQGGLTEDEELALHARLDRSETLREELVSLSDARDWLQEATAHSASTSLKPFFTDRLMRRINRSAAGEAHEEDLSFMLARVFRPVALAGFLLALCIAAYNVHLSRDYAVDTTPAEAILALPPVTSMSVFDLDLYAAETVVLP